MPSKRKRHPVDDLRGAGKLAVEATRRVTELVQAMHQTIGSGPALLGKPLEAPVKLITGLTYGTVKGVTGLVGAGLDAALAQLRPLVAEGLAGPEREAVLAALNGVLGDYLEQTGNPLAIERQLRHQGQALDLDSEALRAALPGATGRLLVLVHGSSMNDRQWLRGGHHHGQALARDGGYTPVDLLYNSGLHISTNGQGLAGLLEALVGAWPRPVEELVLLGHSMGGLVARSACLAGEAAGHRWRGRLSALVTLGTPHHGAPLERGGSWAHLLLGVSRYSAPLGRLAELRSAGVTDLRYGNVRDEDWQGRDRFAPGADPRRPAPLPAGVRCYAAAGALGSPPLGALSGDGLVPVDSALGRHPDPARALAFPEAHQWVGFGLGHLDLLDSPELFGALKGWLT